MIKDRRSVIGYKEIGEAVIVVITGGHTHSIAFPLQACLHSDIGEGAIMIIPEKTIPEFGCRFIEIFAVGLRVFQPGPIDEEHV